MTEKDVLQRLCRLCVTVAISSGPFFAFSQPGLNIERSAESSDYERREEPPRGDVVLVLAETDSAKQQRDGEQNSETDGRSDVAHVAWIAAFAFSAGVSAGFIVAIGIIARRRTC